VDQRRILPCHVCPEKVRGIAPVVLLITDAPEIKPGDESAIRPMDAKEKERHDPDSDVPVYRIDVKLDKEQEDRLTKDYFIEYDAIQANIEALKLPEVEAWEKKYLLPRQ